MNNIQEIKKLSDRDHLLLRSQMYLGSSTLSPSMEYILEDNKIQYKEVQYTPALIKIINEIIDNSVDVAIKTNFKYSNNISIKIESNKVQVQDNGTGIPIKKSGEFYMPLLAFGHARAGSNFDDDENRTQIGMNGVGSFATNVFSKKFIAETDDNKKHYKVIFKDNAGSYIETVSKSIKQGTKVTFYPDLERFNLTEIDEIHILIIKQRLLNLSMSFPSITFKFNNRKVSTGSFKKFVSLFSPKFVELEEDNFRFAILPNSEDDFRHYTYVNGLKIPDGGTHIDSLMYNVVQGLREKLQRKYKNIKPGDIRNKLMLVEFIHNFPNPKFNSQSKEKITNSIKEMNTFYGNIDYTKIVNKILKTPEIIDNITEIYKIKEELQKRKDLKNLDKKVKIKSDKYIRPVGEPNILLICEGRSASSALLPGLGRRGIGYMELKGKPLNAYSTSHAKFKTNKELTELYQIIQNEGYKKICVASDADLDGNAIAGLIIAFFKVYLLDYIKDGRLYRLNTPVGISKKGQNVLDWVYDIQDIKNLKGDVKYMKGLGSWTPEQLKQVIQKDGIDNMLVQFDYSTDDDSTIDDWYASNKTDVRKTKIMNNSFDIIKI